MATVSGRTTYPNRHVMKVVWPSVTNADTFGAVQVDGKYADRTVAVTGTFGSATVLVQGSLDGTNYFTLTGNSSSLSFTTAGLQAVIEATEYVQPSHSGGGGTESVTVTMYFVSSM